MSRKLMEEITRPLDRITHEILGQKYSQMELAAQTKLGNYILAQMTVYANATRYIGQAPRIGQDESACPQLSKWVLDFINENYNLFQKFLTQCVQGYAKYIKTDPLENEPDVKNVAKTPSLEHRITTSSQIKKKEEPKKLVYV